MEGSDDLEAWVDMFGGGAPSNAGHAPPVAMHSMPATAPRTSAQPTPQFHPTMHAAKTPGTKRNVSLHRTPLQKQVEAYIKHNKLKQTHISGEVGINKSLLSIWLRGKVSAKQDQNVAPVMRAWMLKHMQSTGARGVPAMPAQSPAPAPAPAASSALSSHQSQHLQQQQLQQQRQQLQLQQQQQQQQRQQQQLQQQQQQQQQAMQQHSLQSMQASMQAMQAMQQRMQPAPSAQPHRSMAAAPSSLSRSQLSAQAQYAAATSASRGAPIAPFGSNHGLATPAQRYAATTPATFSAYQPVAQAAMHAVAPTAAPLHGHAGSLKRERPPSPPLPQSMLLPVHPAQRAKKKARSDAHMKSISLARKKKSRTVTGDPLAPYLTNHMRGLKPGELPAYHQGAEWLVPIDISFFHDGIRVSEVIMWNMYERHVTPAVFAASFCADLRLPASLADRVAEIIMRALGGFKADLYRVASKSSAAADGQAIAMEDADMLSGRGSPTLESPMPPLSTQHTPQPLSERELMPLRLAERLPVTLPTNRDHLRSMSFRVRVFNRVYSDKMLWDMSGDGNSACAFARTVCSDLGLEPAFQPAIASAVQARVNSYWLGESNDIPTPSMPVRPLRSLTDWGPSVRLVDTAPGVSRREDFFTPTMAQAGAHRRRREVKGATDEADTPARGTRKVTTVVPGDVPPAGVTMENMYYSAPSAGGDSVAVEVEVEVLPDAQ